MKISVITPTSGREQRLRAMVRCFQAQTHSDRELLILDDGREPSGWFGALGDPQVRYRHVPPGKLSLGEKRNLLCGEAQGELIAHFDDDDLYAPAYLERMDALLGGADLLTLSAWFALHEPTGQFFWWDSGQALAHRYAVSGAGITPQTRTPDEVDAASDPNLWGYGFSYLYRRAAWDKVRFPALAFGEDYQFVQGLAAAGCTRVAAPDHQGLVLHVVHGSNASRIFPQYRLPRFAIDRVFGPWLAAALGA